MKILKINWKNQNTVVADSKTKTTEFYKYGSAHRESNLITAQQDVTYSIYYISVGSSTCFGC